MACTLGQWPTLEVYLDDGCVGLDNNPVENAIRLGNRHGTAERGKYYNTGNRPVRGRSAGFGRKLGQSAALFAGLTRARNGICVIMVIQDHGTPTLGQG